MNLCTGVFLLLIAWSAGAQESLKVSSKTWAELSSAEREHIQQTATVDVRPVNSFGVIVDVQGVDQSQPGTNGGAALGAAVGNAAYIDRAFKPGNNYSAKTQLGVALLGAMLGSSIDRPAVQQFQFRYAVKTESGEIQMHDSVQTSVFRHPPGLCVSVPDLQQMPQSLCMHGAVDLRRLYFGGATNAVPVPSQQVGPPVADAAAGVVKPAAPTASGMCKMLNLAPVPADPEKCKSIGGTVL